MVTESIILDNHEDNWRSVSVGAEGRIHILETNHKIRVKVGVDADSYFTMNEGDTLVADEVIYVQKAASKLVARILISR